MKPLRLLLHVFQPLPPCNDQLHVPRQHPLHLLYLHLHLSRLRSALLVSLTVGPRRRGRPRAACERRGERGLAGAGGAAGAPGDTLEVVGDRADDCAVVKERRGGRARGGGQLGGAGELGPGRGTGAGQRARWGLTLSGLRLLHVTAGHHGEVRRPGVGARDRGPVRGEHPAHQWGGETLGIKRSCGAECHSSAGLVEAVAVPEPPGDDPPLELAKGLQLPVRVRHAF
mmetsp:Transcript_1961/g.7023  ORF Transcript_1961/g.7023 Transcript_1961/m.7023 type:complete len:228 (-) Transcript_1961:714-1397(-)